MKPPPDLPPNAINAEIKSFERTECAYNQHREHRVSICATLYRGVIQDVGYSDTMTSFTNLYQFRTDNPDNLVYTKFIDNIGVIESRYPTDQDKSRQWKDFKTHRFVKALKDHDEFRDYLNQKVLARSFIN